MMLRYAIALLVSLAFVVTVLVLMRGVKNAPIFHRLASALFPASQMIVVGCLLYAAVTTNWPLWLLLVVALLGILCMASDVVLFKGLRIAQEKELIEERARLLKEQVVMQERYYERLGTELDEAKKVRTQIVRELKNAKKLFEADQADRAVQRLNQTVGLMDVQVSCWCEHQIVDALVTMKAELCEGAGIRFVCDLNVPDDIGLSGVELCAVFSNIADNAIQGCEGVAPEERFFNLKAHVVKGYLVVVGENSYTHELAEKKLRAQSRNPLLSEHGWGLTILQSVADRHDGMLKTSCHNNVFRTTVTLKVNGTRMGRADGI